MTANEFYSGKHLATAEDLSPLSSPMEVSEVVEQARANGAECLLATANYVIERQNAPIMFLISLIGKDEISIRLKQEPPQDEREALEDLRSKMLEGAKETIARLDTLPAPLRALAASVKQRLAAGLTDEQKERNLMISLFSEAFASMPQDESAPVQASPIADILKNLSGSGKSPIFAIPLDPSGSMGGLGDGGDGPGDFNIPPPPPELLKCLQDLGFPGLSGSGCGCRECQDAAADEAAEQETPEMPDIRDYLSNKTLNDLREQFGPELADQIITGVGQFAQQLGEALAKVDWPEVDNISFNIGLVVREETLGSRAKVLNFGFDYGDRD